MAKLSRERVKFVLGTDFKNKKTAQQEFHQEYNCFLLNNLNWTDRREDQTKLYFLPIGRNKIVHQENKRLKLLFRCFLFRLLNPFPGGGGEKVSIKNPLRDLLNNMYL